MWDDYTAALERMATLRAEAEAANRWATSLDVAGRRSAGRRGLRRRLRSWWRATGRPLAARQPARRTAWQPVEASGLTPRV